MIEADFVVHNIGQLVTCEPAQGEGTLGLLENAAVAAKDGTIVWVGPTGRWQWRLDVAPEALVVDAGGCCVLPGFVDSHAHLLWAGNRADELAATNIALPMGPELTAEQAGAVVEACRQRVSA